MDETEKYIFNYCFYLTCVYTGSLFIFQDIKYPSFVSKHMGVWIKVYEHVGKDSELNIHTLKWSDQQSCPYGSYPWIRNSITNRWQGLYALGIHLVVAVGGDGSPDAYFNQMLKLGTLTVIMDVYWTGGYANWYGLSRSPDTTLCVRLSFRIRWKVVNDKTEMAG